VYPNLYFLVKDLFGVEIELFKIFQMFGIFMAVSFFAAYKIMQAELKRMEQEGKIAPVKRKFWENKAPGAQEYLMNFVFYFLAGFKVVEAALHFSDLTNNPQDFILSARGNMLGGLVAGAIGAYFVYREAQKVKGKEAKQVERLVHPYQLMGNITFVAAVTGLLGAKLFHMLENWSYTVEHPVDAILSFSGLTYYGGLICGGAGVLWYTAKHNIHWRYAMDMSGAAMMLAYGTGRIGCHVAGDGDWGIVNLNPKPSSLSWLPDWAWAYNYPNNVNGVCNPYIDGPKALIDCKFEDTPYLFDPVYPTPIYETLMAFILFGIIWALRKRLPAPGLIFSLYLIFAGIERFIIEKIRVNNPMDNFGGATQAEIISVIMVTLGIGLGVYFLAKPKVEKSVGT
jgi:prolipoprotein diacylglyceryltransferase